MKLNWNAQTPDTQSIHKFKYLECEFDSWFSLRDYFHSESESLGHMGCVFRGHANADWKLEPTLERNRPSGSYTTSGGMFKGWYNGTEKHSIQHFQVAYRHFAKQDELLPPDAKAFDWLSVMQHHGAPTRLLDFSYSPFVAMFFAISELPSSYPRRICIWVFNFQAIDTANKVIFGESTDTFPPEDMGSVYGNIHFGSEKIPNFIALNTPLRPTMRQYRQQGGFLFTLDNNLPFEEVLGNYPNGDDSLVQKLILEIPDRNSFVKIHQEFRRLNLTMSTLFPDLDGYAKDTAIHQYIINT